jgi:hypothetical protein
MVIDADDFDFQDQSAIAKIIQNYVEELGLSNYDQLTSFRWRIDVSARFDNES